MLPIELTYPYLMIGFGVGGATMWAFLRALDWWRDRADSDAAWDAEADACESLGYHAVDGVPQRDYAELPGCVMRGLRRG